MLTDKGKAQYADSGEEGCNVWLGFLNNFFEAAFVFDHFSIWAEVGNDTD